MRAAAILLLALVSCRQSRGPSRMLWAWERPEDLRFLDPGAAGVAYLAATLYLEHGGVVRPEPRRQPLLLPDGVFLVSVVRIEARGVELGSGHREELIARILEYSDRPAVRTLQIDFDAARSQRAFYREMLNELRRRLPGERGLSMTALASWCIHDDWLDGLPVDEAVPMVFRMGADDRTVRAYLDGGRDFLSRACRQSTGVSADEPWPKLPSGRRIWIFSPRPWTAQLAGGALFALRKD